MRVLVTYASAGAGHRRAAEAVYEYLKENRRDLEVELTDILPLAGGFFRFFYNAGYPLLVNRATWLWGFLFWLTEWRLTRGLGRWFSSCANYVGCRRFVKYLKDKNFDFIVSTHFLNSELAANLKTRDKIKSKLITVITDFGVHPFWISEGTDLYIAASGPTKDKLISMGVAPDRIQDSGIPCSRVFTADIPDRKQAAAKLGIDAHKFTLLLMTGSFGSGPLEQIAEAFSGQAQILVVCARNKKLFARLTKRHMQDVKAFGFVNNAQELMAASDAIITKPGGLSIAELLSAGLFPIFISAIPGQEQENARVLSSYGIGCMPKDIAQICRMARELRDEPSKLKALRDAAGKAAKPFACRGISDVIR
jgi:processive 1,2-diacylglycerol beta-glucosyltransferase